MFRLDLIIQNHPIPEDFTSFQLEYLKSGQNFEYSGWNSFLWLTVFGFKHLIHRKHFFLVVNEHWRARLNHQKTEVFQKSKYQNSDYLYYCKRFHSFLEEVPFSLTGLVTLSWCISTCISPFMELAILARVSKPAWSCAGGR